MSVAEWFVDQVSSGTMLLAVPVAVTAGLVSFFSPCVVPLLPGYVSYATGLSGADLTRRAVAQAKRFGVEIISPQTVTGVRAEDPYRVVVLGDGSEISCSALLLASGLFLVWNAFGPRH